MEMFQTSSTARDHSMAARLEFIMRKRPDFQPSAIALAFGALCWSLAASAYSAQAADALTFSSKNVTQQTRGMTEAPLAYTSFAAMAESRVAELRVQLNANTLPADGRSLIEAELTVLDDQGKPLVSSAEVTLEASAGARILLADETANDVDINKMDGNRVQPSKQAKTSGG
mgnify:FL=1